jgi:hypothetical protein
MGAARNLSNEGQPGNVLTDLRLSSLETILRITQELWVYIYFGGKMVPRLKAILVSGINNW